MPMEKHPASIIDISRLCELWTDIEGKIAVLEKIAKRHEGSEDLGNAVESLGHATDYIERFVRRPVLKRVG